MITVAALGLAVAVLGACGGDDDDGEASSTTNAVVTIAPTTVAPATTSTVPVTTTTTVDYVTEGATVIVANASGIDGAAGRLTGRLAAVGYSTGTAVNSTEGQLATSKVYYDADNPDALAVAESLRLALGGGDIEVIEVGTPPPIDTGELGDASVIVTMGNDTADKSLEELQGLVAPATTAPPDDSTDDSTTDSSDG